jgi:hypothetical protein
MDSPVGFKPGQLGVQTWTEDEPDSFEANGILPAWQTDTMRPIADWTTRMAPGTAAVWLMQFRSSAAMSAGADGVRFKALAWAERDDQVWELPLPVTVTLNAQNAIAGEAGESGR